MFSLLVYNSILLSPLLLLLVKHKRSNTLNLVVISTILTYIVLLVSIRVYVGRDFLEYQYIYNHIDNYPSLEIGFILLVKALNYLSLDAQFLYFVIALLIYPLIFYPYLKHKSIIFILCWLVINLLPSLNQLRQYVSISFLTLAIFFYIDKKKYQYFIATFLAAFFHITGVIGFVFYFMSKIKIKGLYIIALFLPLLIFVSLSDLLIKSNLFAGTYYEFYLLDSVVYAGNQTLSIGGTVRLIIPYVFLIKYRKMNTPYFNLVSNAMFTYIALYFLSLNFYILYRVYVIFLILVPFAILSLIKEKMLYRAIVVGYTLLLIVIVQKNILVQTIDPPEGNSVYPYQTIFSDNPIRQYLR